LEYVTCACKKKDKCQQQSCKCRSNGLSCTDLCKCSGCENVEKDEEIEYEDDDDSDDSNDSNDEEYT
jgi:Tesmin/TSO1-like CXC domain.